MELRRRGDSEQQDALAILRWDKELTQSFSVCATTDSKFGQLRPLMKLLEISGHGVPWIVSLIVLLYVTRNNSNECQFIINLLAGQILDLVITATVKVAIKRQRPHGNKKDMFATVSIDAYSFPSGHSSRVVMVMCLFLFEFTFTFKWMYFVVILWSSSVCISRILLGRHHVLDVVGGVVLGMLEYKLIRIFWISNKQSQNVIDYLF
ncbi:polyisoprenoid diphosphate/phosphate phosphohydrolase PLPP6-like [Saccoglossus kowalevskii]|uniref:Presqualene diphosphate phosphatase-like n=1 Tax=Saccoglossus kowalevskii TaxID=10224 RepID=A0ABM0GZK9_SACKO|nr:PREDICTED: presqualene diphosphate phosphatase-like [Saccoglossus kowalevskii]